MDLANVTIDGKYGLKRPYNSSLSVPMFTQVEFKKIIPVALINLVLYQGGLKGKTTANTKTKFGLDEIISFVERNWIVFRGIDESMTRDQLSKKIKEAIKSCLVSFRRINKKITPRGKRRRII